MAYSKVAPVLVSHSTKKHTWTTLLHKFLLFQVIFLDWRRGKTTMHTFLLILKIK